MQAGVTQLHRDIWPLVVLSSEDYVLHNGPLESTQHLHLVVKTEVYALWKDRESIIMFCIDI